jgi:hypothetical protein
LPASSPRNDRRPVCQREWSSWTLSSPVADCLSAALRKSSHRAAEDARPCCVRSYGTLCAPADGWRWWMHRAHWYHATGRCPAHPASSFVRRAPTAAPGARTCCCARVHLRWWCSTAHLRSRVRWPRGSRDWRAMRVRRWCCPPNSPRGTERVPAAPPSFPVRCVCAWSGRAPAATGVKVGGISRVRALWENDDDVS